jgi:hypothetical protein
MLRGRPRRSQVAAVATADVRCLYSPARSVLASVTTAKLAKRSASGRTGRLGVLRDQRQAELWNAAIRDGALTGQKLMLPGFHGYYLRDDWGVEVHRGIS